MQITFTTRHTRHPRTSVFKTIDSWNSLTWAEAVKLAQLSSDFGKTEAIIKFFFHTNKLHPVKIDPVAFKIDGDTYYASILRRRLRRFAISDIDFAAIVKLYSWIYGESDTPDSAITSSSLLPKLHVYNDTLIPPADALTSLTYQQYTIADVWFQKFMKTKELQYLDKLIVSLYSLNGRFNADSYTDYLPIIEDMTFYEKLVVLWYYLGCRKLLAKVFIHLFKTSDKDPETTSDPMLAWMRLTAGMIETPADISVTKKELLWDVFSYLDEKIKQFDVTKTKLKSK